MNDIWHIKYVSKVEHEHTPPCLFFNYSDCHLPVSNGIHLEKTLNKLVHLLNNQGM